MNESPKPSARERILQTAYELFSRRGLRDVSVDEIIGQSGVAIATFYRHFSSKDELAAAFLDRREQVWTSDGLVAEARARSSVPKQQIFAIFDVFDEWFHRDDFEGDSFVNVLLEMGPQHPLGQASIAHLDNVRKSVATMATEAGFSDPDGFAHSYQILMKGSIIAATMGHVDAARRARHMAEHLIAEHEPT
ncbi:MAG: TetR family transcriptional regulator [Homoserinimonas sp.]|jgi:AcrR family transcriptional regulator|nr:TetR family transcriptional regulator [Homoserinimonas sp.]